MKIGVPKEIKIEEHRVALTPSGALELVEAGHSVFVETGAGEESGFTDVEYKAAGATLTDRKSVFRESELIVKVKEPLSPEYEFFREGQALFTYLHLAANPDALDFLLKKKITGLAYETLEKNGRTPLLAPMSEVAGRMAPLMAAFFLQKHRGGSGILPAGTAATFPGHALILGAGMVGASAARIASGLGMTVSILNNTVDRLYEIDSLRLNGVVTSVINRQIILDELPRADLVVGSVLVPGGRTPLLIRREDLSLMKKGSVIVDVSVDQGGCVETSRPTTHADPVFDVDGIVHYCVANMPGAFPRTSTLALTNATLPYIRMIADMGMERALKEKTEIASALNVRDGKIELSALLAGS